MPAKQEQGKSAAEHLSLRWTDNAGQDSDDRLKRYWTPALAPAIRFDVPHCSWVQLIDSHTWTHSPYAAPLGHATVSQTRLWCTRVNSGSYCTTLPSSISAWRVCTVCFGRVPCSRLSPNARLRHKEIFLAKEGSLLLFLELQAQGCIGITWLP